MSGMRRTEPDTKEQPKQSPLPEIAEPLRKTKGHPSSNHDQPATATWSGEFSRSQANLQVDCQIDPAGDILLACTAQDVANAVQCDDLKAFANLSGQFAICRWNDQKLRMLRTIGRPMRYFMAEKSGKTMFFVAERIDQIAAAVKRAGMIDRFRPELTRMVPAHHRIELSLDQGPEQTPQSERFFSPSVATLPVDIEAIGQQYVQRLADVVDAFLDTIPSDQPLGVMFSGGIDSGSIMVLVDFLARQKGWPDERIKAFTLSVIDPKDSADSNNDSEPRSGDVDQAETFLSAMNRRSCLEILEVPIDQVSWQDAVDAIEDYKPLDVQSATMGLAMLRRLRQKYPDWIYLIDGDGGDENLRDYPIDLNPRLNIENVVQTPLLYHEGWGIDATRHSQTYSGGQSRGHSRTSAPGAMLGFRGLSAYAVPSVIDVAEAVPLADLIQNDLQNLYSLKGRIVAAGIKAITGFEMPVFAKQRFQHGAATRACFDKIFPSDDAAYRDYFESKSY